MSAEQNWVRGGETVAVNFTVEPLPIQDLFVQVRVRQSVQGLIRWRIHQTVVISNGKGSMQVHTNQFDGSMGTVDIIIRESNEYDVVNLQERIEVYGVSYTSSGPEPNYAVSNSIAQAILSHIQEPSISTVDNKPVVSIMSLYEYVEEGEPAKIRISTGNSVIEDLEVHLLVSNETNEHENNFRASTTILAGESEVVYEFVTTDDFVPEASYKVLITVVESNSYDIESPGHAEFMLTHENDQLRETINLATQLVLPELAESTAIHSTRTISEHMQLALTGELTSTFSLGGEDSILDIVTSSGNAMNSKNLDLKTVLGDSDFVMQLSPDFMPTSELTIWGLGNQQETSAVQANSFQIVNSELFSNHIGTDLKFGFGGLTGLGISTSETKASYHGNEFNSIEYDAKTNMMSSYFGWISPNQAIAFKVIGGFGHGTVEVQNSDLVPILFDSNIHTMVFSGDAQLAEFGSNLDFGKFKLRLKGDVIGSRSSFSNQVKITNDLVHQSNRMRLFSELSHSLMTIRGSSLNSQLLFGGYRYHDHDSTNINTGFGYQLSFFDARGLKLSMKSLLPLVEFDNVLQNVGIEGEFQFDLGADKLGIQLLGSSKFGSMQDDARFDLTGQKLWGPIIETTNLNSDGRISGKIGFGFNVWNGVGTFTPYSGMSYSGDTYYQYDLGTKVEFGSRAKFELKGTQEIDSSGNITQKVQFNGGINW